MEPKPKGKREEERAPPAFSQKEEKGDTPLIARDSSPKKGSEKKGLL